ncbi:MAG: hypothetical protein JXO49_05695 [Deltaproteobacteria bacterium]|nr:hypothetical protein [Candidatus Anaeroferrophillus wilburensis]MBN2888819.1 hypothetical protein [Deltaproteobacteria bacterium]
MYQTAITIKSYEEIRRDVRGSSFLSISQKSTLTIVLLVGMVCGLLLVDCWGTIPVAEEKLVTTSTAAGKQYDRPAHNFIGQKSAAAQPVGGTVEKNEEKRAAKRSMLPDERQPLANGMNEKQKQKAARIIFLLSLSNPLKKQ